MALLVPVRKQKGQGLIELLIALTVIILALLSLAAVSIVSVRNADFAKKKSKAAKYAQEGMENIRALRDESWTNFWNTYADNNNHGFSGIVPSGNCPTVPNLDVFFIRCSKLEQSTSPTINKVIATVTVSWTDSQGEHRSVSISYFTDKSEWQ